MADEHATSSTSRLESHTAAEIFSVMQLRKAWQELGKLIAGVEDAMNINRCPRCQCHVEPGTVHRMFNGNQMFACTIEQVTP